MQYSLMENIISIVFCIYFIFLFSFLLIFLSEGLPFPAIIRSVPMKIVLLHCHVRLL